MGGSENRSFIAYARSQIRRFNSVYPHDRPSIHHPTSNVIHDLPSSGGPPPSLRHSRYPAAPTISISFLFRVLPRTQSTRIDRISDRPRKKDESGRRRCHRVFVNGRPFFSARSRWSVVMKIHGAASCIVLVPVAFGSCRASTHDRKDMDASS